MDLGFPSGLRIILALRFAMIPFKEYGEINCHVKEIAQIQKIVIKESSSGRKSKQNGRKRREEKRREEKRREEKRREEKRREEKRREEKRREEKFPSSI
ncbi:hypothetical protein HGM15179_010237 [Zosterops borbonicus]|uniref:Uncharacterized protein n=1 Tax=Zosterops borbonicus TaxID=364589 RepID=A0A8K1GFH6_9PASS|nr:hypothetical protein HGM15179_010237 [Zosterops borbonicus]